MRQIAERLVARGHEVTVATTKLGSRTQLEHNGVKIVEFAVTGNLANGIFGEKDKYVEYIKAFDCDAILIKAAQQWTFDALWPAFDEIECRKVFIPCGFSGLYEPSYEKYFQEMPNILRKFDHLIFYADHYRDTDFAREHGLSKFSIIPNGASEIEFEASKDPTFRSRNGIPEDAFLLLTVGSITGMKGHRELLESFVKLSSDGKSITFIMNGNPPPAPDVQISAQKNVDIEFHIASPFFARVKTVFENEGFFALFGRVAKRVFAPLAKALRVLPQVAYVFRSEGIRGIRYRMIQRMNGNVQGRRILALLPVKISNYSTPIAFWLSEAKSLQEGKQLLVTDFNREELVQAYMAADLFVFASNIEYSPLVLFETCAAGTPFLSVPVGNAEEIAEWTQGGFICPAEKDGRGYTRADPKIINSKILSLMRSPKLLEEKGVKCRKLWRQKFSWERISEKYETVLQGTSIN